MLPCLELYSACYAQHITSIFMYNFVLENVLLQYYFILYDICVNFIYKCTSTTVEYQLIYFSEEVSRYLWYQQTSFLLHYLPHTRPQFHNLSIYGIRYIFPVFCVYTTILLYTLAFNIRNLWHAKTHTRANII